MKITGLIMAVNEEAYIERAITNLLPYMYEIIVLDGGSTDKTIEISQKLGARVEYNPWPFNFSEQRNVAHKFVRTDWIAWLDADEYYDEPFFKVMEDYCKDPNYGAYEINRINNFEGWIKDKDYQIRLVRKDCVWTGKIHDIGVNTRLQKGRLPDNIILHHKHSWTRQNYNNKLYDNINAGVLQYPSDIVKD